MLRKYLIFLSILLFFTFILGWQKNPSFRASVYKDIGEKMFLTYHKDDLAIYFLEKSASLNPSNSDTWFLLGRIYFVKNQLIKSLRNFNTAIKLNPNEKELYYGRGLVNGFLGTLFLNDAISDFQKYIEIDNLEFKQTGRHAYGAWAGYNDLAWIYFLKGNFEKAEEISRAGLEISIANPWLSNMLGASLLEQKKCDEADIHLRNAHELMQGINTHEFGEAYSGDQPDFWSKGRQEMSKTIEENLEICKSIKS